MFEPNSRSFGRGDPTPLPQDTDISTWDQVNECSIEVPSRRLVIAGCTDYLPDAARIEVSPGSYRARVHYGNLGSLSPDGLDGGDHYRVVLWSAPAAPLQVLKQVELSPLYSAVRRVTHHRGVGRVVRFPGLISTELLVLSALSQKLNSVVLFGDRMLRIAKATLVVSLAFVLCAVIYAVVFFDTSLWVLKAWKIERTVPATNIIPAQVRDTSISSGQGKKLAYFRYEFEVPWDDLDDARSKLEHDTGTYNREIATLQ